MHEEIAEVISRKFFDAVKADPEGFGDNFYTIDSHQLGVIPICLVEQTVLYAVENFESTVKEIQDNKKREDVESAIKKLREVQDAKLLGSQKDWKIEELIETLEEMI